MKGKVRNAIIIAAGVLVLTVMLTVVLYYYNDKVMRDNAWVFSVEETSYNENSYSYVQKPLVIIFIAISIITVILTVLSTKKFTSEISVQLNEERKRQ